MTRGLLLLALLGSSLAVHATSYAQQTPAPAKLYAVEFKIGPKWVADKAPHEQEFFREHSANLRKLRERGSLILGARYGDIGLVVLSTESKDAARAMVDDDPSIRNGTFSYELNEFSVFYGGEVQPAPRKPKAEP